MKITECHVTIGSAEYNKVCSTFVLSSPVQMEMCHNMILGYLRDRIVFTVTYS